MTRVLKILQLAGFMALLVGLSYGLGQLAYGWLPPQASAAAPAVDRLFSLVVTLGSLIFFGLTGVILYSAWLNRVKVDDWQDGPPITGNPKLETLWTVTPILLVLGLAVYSNQIYHQMGLLGDMPMVNLTPPAYADTPPAEPVTIQVKARQWTWQFTYPDAQVTSDVLHLPVDRPVRLELRSQDVLHGFFVPEFRLKQDIIPGRTISLHFVPTRPGRYTLYDSQFSGTYFALMQAQVQVESADAYQQWLTQPPDTASENAAYAEHRQQQQHTLTSHWPTVEPAP